MRKLIRKRTGARYGISGVRKMMGFWEYSQKVPVRRHVRRASPDAIAMFQEWARHIMPKRISEGHAAAIQDGVSDRRCQVQKEDVATNLFPAVHGSRDIL